LTPALDHHLEQQQACSVENELLGLPSELMAAQRVDLNVVAFSRTEGELRDGAALDTLSTVKLVAKALVGLKDRKRRNDSGMYKNTISQKQINDTERRRNLHIATYMASRQALINLGLADGVEDFPPLPRTHS
jgi:hypothetical protein